jgi:hypothetical protein
MVAIPEQSLIPTCIYPHHTYCLKTSPGLPCAFYSATPASHPFDACHKTTVQMPLMEQDLFFYFGDEGVVENLTKYKRGGFHPVQLGDILPKPGTCKSDEERQPRYRISQKLGFGAFSTVWLARDLLEKSFSPLPSFSTVADQSSGAFLDAMLPSRSAAGWTQHIKATRYGFCATSVSQDQGSQAATISSDYLTTSSSKDPMAFTSASSPRSSYP